MAGKLQHPRQHSLGSVNDHTDGADWTSLQTTFAANSGSWSAAQNLSTQVGGSVFVCPSGSDVTGNGSRATPYATVSHAMGTITDASANKPYVIRVLCGVVNDVPFATKPYVFIQGSNQSGTRLKAISGDTPFIKLGLISTLDNLTILGPASSVALSAVGASCAVRECSIRPNGTAVPGQYAIYADLSAGARLDSCNITNCDVGLYITNDALVRSFETDFRSCNAAIKVNGSSEADLRANAIFTSTSGVVGIDAESIHMLNMHIEDTDYGVIADGTSNIDGALVHIHEKNAGSTILDLWQKDGNSTIDIDSAKFNLEKMSFADTSKIFVNLNSELVGDEAKVMLEELHVGQPEQGRETVLGEGDSYIRDTLIWTYDADNLTWTNVSLSARSATGSTFFMPSAQNSYTYIASDLKYQGNGDYLKHFGIKTSTLNTITFDTSADIIDIEYWNGSSWAECASMMCGGNSPYRTYGHDLFTVSGSNQIRYNQKIDSLWKANSAVPDGNGVNRYWTRIHTLSTWANPIEVEQIKLHTNRYEINSDGWTEYFGRARPIGSLPIKWNNAYPAPNPDTPTNISLGVATNLTVGVLRNGFIDQNTRVGFITPVPYDLDTSTPVTFRGAFILDQAASVDITFDINYVWTQNGDYINYGAPAAVPSTRELRTASFTLPAASAANADSLYWGEVELNVAEVRSRRTDINGTEFPDILWTQITRTDADAAKIAMVNVDFAYAKWCDGGHFL